MNHIISQKIFDYLLDHMLDIHRRKLNIISAYALDYDAYTSKLNFLNAYIRGIESFLEASRTESADNDMSLVILDSVVRLRCKGSGEKLAVKIVLPQNASNREERGVRLHSCFSDWAHALLLKKPGESIRIGESGMEYILERVDAGTSLCADTPRKNSGLR